MGYADPKDPRAKVSRIRYKHSAKGRKARAAYRERAKAVERHWKDNWRKKYPAKYIAGYLMSNAVRDGRLKRKPCEVCGKKRVHGHHKDYSKPLAVTWLCPKHHYLIHQKEG